MNNPMAATAALQQDLESGIARLRALNARMQDAQSLHQNLQVDIAAARQSFDISVQAAASHLQVRGAEVAHRLSNTLQKVAALAEQLGSASNELEASHQPLVDELEGYHQGLGTTAQTLSEEQQAFVAAGHAFEQAAAQRIVAISAEDQTAAQDYHLALVSAASHLADQVAELSSTGVSQLRAHLNALNADGLQPFGQHVDQVAQGVENSFDGSRSVIERSLAGSVEGFANRNRGQRQGLVENSTALVTSLDELGRQLDVLTTTLVDGGEGVHSMLNLSTVGIRSAIEAFESVQRLMDEIIGEMG